MKKHSPNTVSKISFRVKFCHCKNRAFHYEKCVIFFIVFLQKIKLEFTDISIEPHKNCKYDYVKVWIFYANLILVHVLDF